MHQARGLIRLLGALLAAGITRGAEAATFDLWFASGGAARAAIEAECTAFNAAQNRDRIVCTNLGDYETVLQRTAAAFRAGRQPALAQILDAATAEMIESGAVKAVAPFLSARGFDSATEDYPPAVRRFFGDARGELLAVPFNISTLLLYVNEDKLARAGIQATPETWEDFEAALRHLQAAGEACPFAFRLDPWWWLEQFGAVAGEPIAALANGQEGLAAVYRFGRTAHRRMMLDLFRWNHEGLAVLFDNNAIGSPQRAFAGGACAMVLESSGTAGAFAALAAGRFRVSAHPLPRYADHPRHGSLPGGAALWVMQGFDPETYRAVAEFLAFVRDPGRQAAFARATGYLPLSLPARQRFAEAGTPLQIQAVGQALASLDGGDPSRAPRLGYALRFRAAWIEEMQRAFAGRQTIDAALERAERRGNALLRRFERLYGAAVPASGGAG